MSTPTQTDPTKVGAQTSEFKITLGTVLACAGAVVAGITVTLTQLSETFPHAAWMGGALSVVGVLGSVMTAVGYNKGRAVVKATMIQAAASGAAAMVAGNAPGAALQALQAAVDAARAPTSTQAPPNP